MELGAADRDSELRQQIKIMPWSRFEQLVFDLLVRTEDGVLRMKAPDGGADILRPASDEAPVKVWQAKRYGDQINWKKCENSLARAAEAWKPNEIVFAFARDFSEPVAKSFREKLVIPGSRLGIAVTAWTLSEIVRRLDDNEDLKLRYFGKPQESLMSAMERTIKAGGKLEDGEDLLERAKSLTEYTEAVDPDFTYSTTSGPATTPAPNWDELPYMTMAVGGEKVRVEVSSWTREGSKVEQPSFAFKNGEAGLRARQDAVQALARGEEAVLTEGVHLRFHAPELFKDLIRDASASGDGQVRLQPGEALAVQISILSDDGEVIRDFEVRPVPAMDGAAAAYAGYIGLALIEINLFLLEKPTMRATVTLGGRFGPHPCENRELAELMIAFMTHTEVTLSSVDLFPGSGQLSGKFSEGKHEEDLLENLQARISFYADLVEIEEATDQPLAIPDEFTHEDVAVAEVAAEILREGGGTATFNRTEGIVENPYDIPALPEQFRIQGSVNRMVSYELFGKPVNLGVGRYELPELKIVDVVPQGHRPDAPARVVLEAADDDQIRFRLLAAGDQIER
jgi:hypothetical protein